MFLPPMTNMTLQVQNCTGLKRITNTKLKQDLKSAQDEFRNAQDKFRKLAENMLKLDRKENDMIDPNENEKDIQKALNEIKEKEAALKNCPVGDDGKVIPNPFVVIAIDEDNEDRRPMLSTKVVRAETNPIWKEKFDKFPLFLYLQGKIGYERFANGDKDYRPQNLVFIIYHDDGIPKDDEAKPSEDSWKREKPQRKIPIGRVEWDFHDVCRNVGCNEFEKDLPIIDPDTRRKIKDATFTFKVKLCAPNSNCDCIVQGEVVNVIKEQEPEVEVEVEEAVEEKLERRRSPYSARKFVRSKSRNRLPPKTGVETHVPFQKPTKKYVSKKVRFINPVNNVGNNDAVPLSYV